MLSLYGGRDQPCCGFGFGDCVIMELLKDRNLLPATVPLVDDVVIVLNEELRGPAVRVAEKLRAQGRSVDMILGKKKKLQWGYHYAARVGAKRVVLLAPDEWAQGLVCVKNLRDSLGRGIESNNQELVPFGELV